MKTSLITFALACWVFLPTIAAAIAYIPITPSTLVWTVAVFAILSVVFETPRDWILDRFQ